MDALIFRELENNPHLFFKILPKEWQDEIVPFWDAYNAKAKIYIIESQNNIIGGGIVFYKSPPHFAYFEAEADNWFKENYLYLGFIWIAEQMRNNNLGSFWLDQLKLQNPEQKYFLLTEEEQLHRFYTKNSFVCEKTLNNHGVQEWLFRTGDKSDLKL